MKMNSLRNNTHSLQRPHPFFAVTDSIPAGDYFPVWVEHRDRVMHVEWEAGYLQQSIQVADSGFGLDYKL